MKVLEQYYGRRRYNLIDATTVRGSEMECYIRVEVNDKAFAVNSFFPQEVPMKIALKECQNKLMRELQFEVFGV